MTAYLILVAACAGLISLMARSHEQHLVVWALVMRLAMIALAWSFFVPAGGTYVISTAFQTDDLKYYETGLAILDAGTLFFDPTALGIEVNPGFQYLVGALFLLFGDVWLIPNGISFLAGLALPVAVTRLAEASGHSRANSIAAGRFALLLPNLAFFSIVGYKDQLTLLVTTTLLLRLVLHKSTHRRVQNIASIVVLGMALGVLRIGILPLVVLTYGALVLRVRSWREVLAPLLLLLVSVLPFLAWLESSNYLDRFVVAEIAAKSGSESGLALRVLSGGPETWPLRALIFLVLPYPSLSGIADAWQLYTWLNVGWYALLCASLPGIGLLLKHYRESANRMVLLPLAWTGVVVLSLMVRGMPNARYVLMITPAMAILASYSLSSRRAMLTAFIIMGAAPIAMVSGYMLLQSVL